MMFALLLAVGAAIDLSNEATVTRADQVAASLAVLIDPSSRSPDRIAALDRLDRLGARPMTDADRATVAGWRGKERLRSVVWRGRMLGPGFRQGTLAPGEALEFAQIFMGGQAAAVAVTSAPANSVTLSIMGGVGTVCTGRTRCGWQQRFTERVNVRVANGSSEPRRFMLVVD